MDTGHHSHRDFILPEQVPAKEICALLHRPNRLSIRRWGTTDWLLYRLEILYARIRRMSHRRRPRR